MQNLQRITLQDKQQLADITYKHAFVAYFQIKHNFKQKRLQSFHDGMTEYYSSYLTR